jgi:hypothetical protein
MSGRTMNEISADTTPHTELVDGAGRDRNPGNARCCQTDAR